MPSDAASAKTHSARFLRTSGTKIKLCGALLLSAPVFGAALEIKVALRALLSSEPVSSLNIGHSGERIIASE
jgi:hypothetical protein